MDNPMPRIRNAEPSSNKFKECASVSGGVSVRHFGVGGKYFLR